MKNKNKITIIYLLVYKKKKHLFQSVDLLINSTVFYCDHFVSGIESDKLPWN